MNEYYPNKWVVVKITSKYHPLIYKVFSSLYSGYHGADSFKLNSGIVKVSLEGSVYSFAGNSGSVYRCHKNDYGTSMYGGGVLDGMIKRAATNGVTIEILLEEINWLGINYAN